MIFNPIFLQEFLPQIQPNASALKFQNSNYLFADIINVYEESNSKNSSESLINKLGNNLFNTNSGNVSEPQKVTESELIKLFQEIPSAIQVVDDLKANTNMSEMNTKSDAKQAKILSVEEMLNKLKTEGRLELKITNEPGKRIVIQTQISPLHEEYDSIKNIVQEESVAIAINHAMNNGDLIDKSSDAHTPTEKIKNIMELLKQSIPLLMKAKLQRDENIAKENKGNEKDKNSESDTKDNSFKILLNNLNQLISNIESNNSFILNQGNANQLIQLSGLIETTVNTANEIAIKVPAAAKSNTNKETTDNSDILNANLSKTNSNPFSYKITGDASGLNEAVQQIKFNLLRLSEKVESKLSAAKNTGLQSNTSKELKSQQNVSVTPDDSTNIQNTKAEKSQSAEISSKVLFNEEKTIVDLNAKLLSIKPASTENDEVKPLSPALKFEVESKLSAAKTNTKAENESVKIVMGNLKEAKYNSSESILKEVHLEEEELLKKDKSLVKPKEIRVQTVVNDFKDIESFKETLIRSSKLNTISKKDFFNAKISVSNYFNTQTKEVGSKINGVTPPEKTYTVQIIDEKKEAQSGNSELSKVSSNEFNKTFVEPAGNSELASISWKPSLKITKGNVAIGRLIDINSKAIADESNETIPTFKQDVLEEKSLAKVGKAERFGKAQHVVELKDEHQNYTKQEKENKLILETSAKYSDTKINSDFNSGRLNDQQTILYTNSLVEENKKAGLKTNETKNSEKVDQPKDIIESAINSEKNNNTYQHSSESNEKSTSNDNMAKINSHSMTELKTSFGEAIDKNMQKTTIENRQNSMNETIKTIQHYELQDELKKIMMTPESKNITLKLSPENLGKVNVTIDIADNVMNTKVNVETESVKQLVQSTSESLRNSLNENGIQLASFTVNLSSAEDKNNNRHVIKAKRKNNHSSDNFTVENEAVEIKQKNFGYNTYDYIM